MADVLEKGVTVQTANVTVVTTAETVVVTSPLVIVPVATCQVLIKAYCVMATAAGTVEDTPRIRQGSTTAGALVGEANTQELQAAAGSAEPFYMMVAEGRSNVESVQYCMTIQQGSATGNGTILYAAIEVEVLNG